MNKHLAGKHNYVGWGERKRAFQAERKATVPGNKHLGECKHVKIFIVSKIVKCEMGSDKIWSLWKWTNIDFMKGLIWTFKYFLYIP